jgi:hypothetical protein
VFTGLQLLHEGNVAKGVETILPAAVRNVVRSARYAATGEEVTLDGDQVLATDAGDVLARALGFTPGELALQYDRNSALKGADAKLLKRRRSLMLRYAMAVRGGDPDGARETLADMRGFNAANPAYAITRDTIERSMRARLRNDAMSRGGIVMSRRLIALEAESGE